MPVKGDGMGHELAFLHRVLGGARWRPLESPFLVERGQRGRDARLRPRRNLSGAARALLVAAALATYVWGIIVLIDGFASWWTLLEITLRGTLGYR